MSSWCLWNMHVERFLQHWWWSLLSSWQHIWSGQIFHHLCCPPHLRSPSIACCISHNHLNGREAHAAGWVHQAGHHHHQDCYCRLLLPPCPLKNSKIGIQVKTKQRGLAKICEGMYNNASWFLEWWTYHCHWTTWGVQLLLELPSLEQQGKFDTCIITGRRGMVKIC